MSPRDTREARNGRPAVAPRRALPSLRPRWRMTQSATDGRDGAPRPRRTRDRWWITLAALGTLAFAVVFAAYILEPAMTTLVDASSALWSGEGP